MRLALLLLATSLLSGCVSISNAIGTWPVTDSHHHREISWRFDYEAANREAEASGKPVLLILMAGDIDGEC